MSTHGRHRLLPVVALTWATAFALTMIPDAASVVAGALWVAGLVVLAAMTVRSGRARTTRLALVIISVSLVAAAVTASHVAFAQPARDGLASLAVAGGRAIEMRADVVGKLERRADGLLAFDAVARSVTIGDRAHVVRGEVIVRVSPDDLAPGSVLDVGAVVDVFGTAMPADPGRRAVLEVRASRGVSVTAPAQGAPAVTGGLRRGLVAAAEGLPGWGAGLVPGLAVGDTSAVDPELDAAMKRSSLSHLTAVSGANCALVVGLAFLAAAALGASRAVRVGVGLAALGGFVLLVTPEPSVVRAAAMASIAMLAVLLGRPGVGMAVLSVAVTVILVADPWLAGSLGFALSATATASLLLFARPFAIGLQRVLPRALALGLSVPLAAQLACGPLLILIEPSVPLYGVVANMLAAPAAPIATVLGLAACLAAPLPWLQSGLAALAWLPASWIAGTAASITTLPGDVVPWVEGVPGAALLAGLGVAVGVLVAVAPGRWRAARGASGALVALVVGIAGGGALSTGVAGPWGIPRDWSIIACDVGQGDAVLVRSAGQVALMDAGPDPAALDACLRRVGVDRIDLLVLSHFDLDHVGGVSALEGRVTRVLHGPPADAADERIITTLVAGGARSDEAASGMSGALGGARWSVLWPRAESPAFPSGNDASVVLDVRGGGVPPTLMLGDLSASPQRALAASGALSPPYAIVKVAHHGSADQEPALYVAAEPSVALVTVGADNDFGHPRREILDVVSALGARVARTDTQGLIVISPRRDGVAVWRERVGGDE
ncbi:ComEC/Rec2 family competence protein [Planococcus sp. APC 4015]|nr:ComEC/Rec2 family competence protein [Planococcus sp. APC 4015]